MAIDVKAIAKHPAVLAGVGGLAVIGIVMYEANKNGSASTAVPMYATPTTGPTTATDTGTAAGTSTPAPSLAQEIADVTGTVGAIQQLQSMLGGSPSQTTVPNGNGTSDTTTPPQYSFMQILSTVLPSVYSKSGFAGNTTDSTQGTQDLFNTLQQFNTQNDPNYSNWLAQLQAASSAGDVNQYHQLILQGEQFAQSTQGQTVVPVGTLQPLLNSKNLTPNAGQYWIPSQNNGAGGYGNYQQWWSSQHPSAGSPAGGGGAIIGPTMAERMLAMNGGGLGQVNEPGSAITIGSVGGSGSVVPPFRPSKTWLKLHGLARMQAAVNG